MNGRRVLVIGSQCRRLGHLSFPPEVAVRLHALMIDPGPGECLGAEIGDPPGLLLEPAGPPPRPSRPSKRRTTRPPAAMRR